VLSGRSLVLGAIVQTLLLVAMNVGGLVWGREQIADPAGMLVQNLAFLALVWLNASERATSPGGETGWRGGRFDAGSGPPLLLFGRMYEDWRIEAEAFPPGSDVFCIASAGCTALALAARGHTVTAVDINPAQIEYVKERLRGAPPREGAAERMIRRVRALVPFIGWSGEQRRLFLTLDDPAEQLRRWDTLLDTARFRWLARAALSRTLLLLFLNPALLRALPENLGDDIRRRFRRGFARHPNRDNLYAWKLLLGELPPGFREPALPERTPEVLCDDAAAYLERCAPGRFGGFSLSNIFDGADAVYARRLWAAVRRAAAPNAIVVVRSFAAARNAEEEERAARDRGMIWGRVSVGAAASGGAD
jgi:S-adenosylmethionine:diacylglycerol 3-amino-3-carboxypropyl transferase